MSVYFYFDQGHGPQGDPKKAVSFFKDHKSSAYKSMSAASFPGGAIQQNYLRIGQGEAFLMCGTTGDLKDGIDSKALKAAHVHHILGASDLFVGFVRWKVSINETKTVAIVATAGHFARYDTRELAKKNKGWVQIELRNRNHSISFEDLRIGLEKAKGVENWYPK